jgi:membrane-associated phospholipid phosphatase
VNRLIVLVAQDLLFVLAAVAALVWLTRRRAGKARLAAETVTGLALVGVGIWVAAHLHADPRPFMHDPRSTPLFAHPADNGFPSDHSAAGGLLTALVFRHRRPLGVLVAAGAVLVAWARVAAHVHHAQDVVAGLAIGLTAGVLAIWLVHLLLGYLHSHGRLPASGGATASDRVASHRIR